MSSTSDIPHPTSDMLRQYLDLLLEANKQFNLTAVRDPDLAWRRLILDSLTLREGLEDATTVIDIGTGGGIPGMPLAISLPGARFTLVDATGKKVRFVGDAIKSLGLTNATVLQARAEELGQDRKHRESYDAAVSRAVGTVAEVLEYTLPLVQVGGRVLLLKGKEAEEQLEKAGDALTILGAGDVAVFDAYPEGEGDTELVIISVLKEHETPDDYPRRPGIPKAEPL